MGGRIVVLVWWELALSCWVVAAIFLKTRWRQNHLQQFGVPKESLTTLNAIRINQHYNSASRLPRGTCQQALGLVRQHPPNPNLAHATCIQYSTFTASGSLPSACLIPRYKKIHVTQRHQSHVDWPSSNRAYDVVMLNGLSDDVIYGAKSVIKSTLCVQPTMC